MNQADLLALSERLFNQLGFEYGIQDEGEGLIIPTEDDDPVYIAADLVEDGDGRDWPVLNFVLPLVEEVNVRKVDRDLIIEANEVCGFGSVVLLREQEAVVLYHSAVGWPGAAEYNVTLQLLVSSADDMRQLLDGRMSGKRPLPYSEVVR
jgi:hypothetical protein